MAVKILLSVSLLSWLLLFCSDCGLQGVEASPLSETFPIRLDDLKGFSPKKISVINETLSTNHKAGQRALEIAELYYEGIAVTSYVPANSTLLVIYIDGWIVEAIRGTISWLENPGDFWLIGGPGLDYWGITFETSEEVLGYTYELVAVVSRLTPDRTAAAVEAERIPVERTFRFDDRELKVKGPPEVRQEINYSK